VHHTIDLIAVGVRVRSKFAPENVVHAIPVCGNRTNPMVAGIGGRPFIA
jgi:hypothetical protein